MAPKRSFLFLQGVCSPFFARLADRLAAAGHRVTKVNFNCGDVVYWWPRPSHDFRGPLAALPGFLDEVCARDGITDQVLFGDRRPVHRPAVEGAARRGVRTHVLEEGYFRPWWITLERGGVNAHSQLPRDPDWYRAVGRSLPECGDGVPFVSPLSVRVFHDLAYHLAGLGNPLFFPRYRNHAPASAPVEYIGHDLRWWRRQFRARRDARTVAALVGGSAEFFLLPLQLGSDAQIRDHSPFDGMDEVMEYVISSFARHAPDWARLAIKNHPLDSSLTNHEATARRAARQFGVEGRVDYIESGDLDALLRRARGIVTVNSTVGTLALSVGRPVHTLGDPVYNLPGLTFQGRLDEFWRAPAPPDPELFRCFRRVVIRGTQVNGGFYCDGGIALAVANCLPALVAERSPLEELL